MASQGIVLPRVRSHLLTRVQVIKPLRDGRVRRLRMRRTVAETGTEMAGLGLPGYEQDPTPKPVVDFSFNLSPEQQQQVAEEIRTGSGPTIGPVAPAPAQPSFWSKLSTGFQSFATAVTPVASSLIQYKAATDAQSLAERQAAAAKAQAEADLALAMAQAGRAPVSTTPKWIIPAAIVGAGLLVTILVMKKK